MKTTINRHLHRQVQSTSFCHQGIFEARINHAVEARIWLVSPWKMAPKPHQPSMVRLASLFALMTPVSRAKGFLHLICWLFI
jgi:hypothetical protein